MLFLITSTLPALALAATLLLTLAMLPSFGLVAMMAITESRHPG